MGNQAQATKEDSIAIGRMAHALGKSSTALGSEYNEESTHGDDDYTTAKGDYSTALGAVSKALEFGTTAVGHRAYAMAKHAISIGFYSEANAEKSIALGVDSKANGENSVAVGANTNAAGSKSLALGFHAEAKAAGAIVLGSEAEASGSFSVIIGNTGKVSGGYNIGLGYGAEVSKIYGIALGHNANVAGEGGIALGVEAKVKEMRGIALGYSAGVTKKYGMALGPHAEVTGEYSLALGYVSKVSVDNGVAIGSSSISDRAAGVAGYTSLLQGSATNTEAQWKSTRGAVSVGNPNRKITRQITNVAAGSEDADAVNVAQLKGLEEVVRKNGWKLSVDGKNAKTVLLDSDIDFSAGSQNFAITKGNDDNKVKFDLAKDLTLKSIKLGGGSVSDDRADAVSPVTLDTTGLVIFNGPQITASGIKAGSKKITGVKEGSDDTDAVNFGQLQKVEKDVKEQVAASSFVKQDSDTKHITIGKETDGDKIDITNKNNGARTLTGLKSASLSEASKEAVTGSQLFETNKNVATYLGGGADYKDGKWSVPTFTVKTVDAEGQEKNTNYKNVAEALAGVGSSITNVKNEITKEVNNTISSVKGDALLWGEEEGAFVAQHGGKETNSKITSLQDGVISSLSTDAVTGKQLYSVGDALSRYLGGGAKYENGQWTAPSFKVNTVKDDGQEKGETYYNVADALSGVGTSFTNVQNKITKEITDKINNAITNVQGDSLVKKDSKTNNITIGREVEGTEIDITNSKSELRTLSGVKEATKVNEAINKGQFDKGVKKLTEDLQFENSFAVHYDKKSNDNGIEADYTNITLGKGQDASPVSLHNVADGTIAKDSHDAVNGGQINTIGEDIVKLLGGNTSFEDGSFTTPTYNLSSVDEKGEITNTSFTNVGKAFEGIDTNIRNVNQRIKDITQDSLSWSAADKAFSAQHEEGEKKTKSKITHLLDGNISKDSTDAITGGQLYSMSNTLATYLGGNAKYENGTWIAPIFKLTTVNGEGKEEEKTYPDVAKALEGVGSAIANIQNKVTEQVNNVINKLESDSLVQQDKATNHITIGAKIEGSVINIANKNGEDRTISGVKAATQENEAINKGQFDTSIQDVNNEITNKFNELNQNITDITQQVKGDSLLWNSEKGAFVAQHGEEKTDSKITFLANGDITENSADAINGSQLYSMGNSLAVYLGGGAEYNEGNWTAPTFTFKTVQEDGEEKDETYQNVAEALSGVGKSFTNIQNKITNEITNEINKTKGDALLWDNKKEAFVAQHGEEKTNSKISFLANGDITKNSMDAINGSQLYAVINSLSGYFGGGAEYKDGQWKEPTFYVSQFKNDGNGDSKKDYHDVAAAFEGVNGSLSNINERINIVSKDISSSSLNWNETEKAYDARHNNKDSKITHVADGKVSEDSKEAVNGSQLWETNKKVEAVEERVENIDQHVKDIENTVTNDAVKYDKGADGKKTNKVTLVGGNESDPVLLDNVAVGELSKDSKQAVNGSQLWEMNQQMKTVLDDAKKYTDERFNDIINSQMGDVINEAKSYTDMKFEGLRYELKEVRKESRQAAAIGLAVSNLSYEDTPGSLSLSIGTGVWRSQSAFAIGAGYMSENGKIRSNISATSSGGHWGIGAGLRVKLN
nr:Vomp family autotransporter [Bartonella sp. ML71XJBT]